MSTVATVLSGLTLLSGPSPGSSDLCSAAAFSSSARPSVTAGAVTSSALTTTLSVCVSAGKPSAHG